MRIGFSVVLFVLILNLVSVMVYELNMPGTAYSSILYLGSEANATEFETEFNATTLLDRWTATPFSGVPIFGDIFSGIYLLWNAIESVVMGFPAMVERMSYAIPDASARGSLTTIMYVIRAVFSFVVFGWLFQLITGRKVSE